MKLGYRTLETENINSNFRIPDIPYNVKITFTNIYATEIKF